MKGITIYFFIFKDVWGNGVAPLEVLKKQIEGGFIYDPRDVIFTLHP